MQAKYTNYALKCKGWEALLQLQRAGKPHITWWLAERLAKLLSLLVVISIKLVNFLVSAACRRAVAQAGIRQGFLPLARGK